MEKICRNKEAKQRERLPCGHTISLCVQFLTEMNGTGIYSHAGINSVSVTSDLRFNHSDLTITITIIISFR